MPVTLIGGGPVSGDDLALAIQHAPRLLAADSGADRALCLGYEPELIIGDLDSVSRETAQRLPVVKITEQDTTDFEKSLRIIDAPLVLGVGFSAGRVDHTLAALHTLIKHHDQRVILLGEEDILFAAPTRWQASLPIGTRLSFFPVSPCTAIGSTGLEWPIDGLLFEGGAQIGTSNRTNAAKISARFDKPGCVTILPRACLTHALDSFSASPF